MKLARWILPLAMAAAWPAAGQTPVWDSSGNALLQGTYYFREVFYIVGDSSGDLSEALALYGNVTFSGTGTYTMAATVMDSNYGYPQTGTLNGTYSISASGYGFLSNPLSSGDFVYGMVSAKGIFIGSSTESGFNDLFVAAPVSSPSPTNATFKGNYTLAGVDLSSGSPVYALSTWMPLTPDGAGNLGNVSVTGYVGGGGSTVYTQSMSRVTYSFSNGAGVLNFPNTNNLISGQKYLYISPDGDFVFGGSPLSWDFFVGVRTTADAPNFGGLYYQAGIDEDDSQLANGFGNLDTYFGALSASGGSIVGHQRLENVFNSNALDFTYSDTYNVKSDGTYSNAGMKFVVGSGGAVRIGSGIGPFIGLNVALAAPSLSGDGVFLNPQGVVNAASNAPFTASLAPGELLNLYGTGLAADTVPASGAPLPNTLDSVQVTFNGTPAPLYAVSPGVISAIVPYGITGPIVQIQVNNNGNLSNTITNFVGVTAPGAFTVAGSGLGEGLITHSDGTPVNAASPAQPGETVTVAVTGLGAVNPAIADGAAGPTDTPSVATNMISVYIGGVQASVGQAGLTPGLTAMYQITVTVPTGLTAGDQPLDITGPDSYSSEAVISVAGSSTAAVAPAVAPHRPARSVISPALNPGRVRSRDRRAGQH